MTLEPVGMNMELAEEHGISLRNPRRHMTPRFPSVATNPEISLRR